MKRKEPKPSSTKAVYFALAPIIVVLGALLLLAYSKSIKEDVKTPGYIQNVGTMPSPVATIFSTAVAPTVNPATQVPTEPPMTVQHLREVNFGSWSYSAGQRSDSQIIAGVSYDNTSINGLNVYATANRVLATQLASAGVPIKVNITFRTYMQPEAFRAWVSATGLQATRTEFRYVDGSGLDTTVWYAAQNEEALPQSFINEELEWAQQNKIGVREFKGVYFTSGAVAANRLPQIVADPTVFLVDVTHQAVINDLVAAGIPGAAQAIVSVTPPSPFWKMEHDFGLQNFQINVTPTVPIPTPPLPTTTVPVP